MGLIHALVVVLLAVSATATSRVLIPVTTSYAGTRPLSPDPEHIGP